jgi:serine/threonine protein kinase
MAQSVNCTSKSISPFDDVTYTCRCHFDIKPNNILLCPGPTGHPYDVQFKLGDLGSSVYCPLVDGEEEVYVKQGPGTQTYGTCVAH